MLGKFLLAITQQQIELES